MQTCSYMQTYILSMSDPLIYTSHTCNLCWARMSRGCKAGLRCTAFCAPPSASSNAITASRLYPIPSPYTTTQIYIREEYGRFAQLPLHYSTMHYGLRNIAVAMPNRAWGQIDENSEKRL